MELGGKAGGAERGQLLAGGPQNRVGGRQSVPVGRDLMFHFEQDLQEERRALKKDQKMHRSKAMKYLMETNRRRRAFEERQKEEEAKEQRFREQVLQQRKIKFQEATAKFQHAHQSFSQQKQTALMPPVQTKAAFQLEEALEQIKGSVLTPGQCLQNINKINFRSTDETSCSSACRSDSFRQKQNSATFGCDETIQESSRTDVDSRRLLFQKNLKEMQQLLEKQHLNNLENFHQEIKETDDSDSLMSLDSLEAGEQNGNCTTQSESSFTTQCDCALYEPEKCQTRNNGLLHTDQSTSKNVHLNNCLRNVDLLHYHNIPIHDLLAKHNVLTPAERVNTSEEESSASHRSGKQPAEFSASGSFSAKKAWMVSKGEASKPPVCSTNAKEGDQLKNKAKITRRATSVRVQSHFMPMKRRGTLLQLQSATEANQTQKAPGKYLAPHPPSTPLPGNRSAENTGSPGCHSLPPACLQATGASSSDFNGRHVVPASQVLNRNSAENSENIAGCAGLATAISTADCSTAKDKPWAKNICSVNSVKASACQDHSVTCSERRPVNTENRLHLHHIPAAGKTSTFWHGAHSTQAPKESATGSVPVTRQNQAFGNYEIKYRGFSECRRQSVISEIWKPAHHAQNSLCPAVQLSPIQSAFDPVQKMKNISKSEEVSESTAQFLVAEKLANTPIAEGEILAAMDHVKPARQLSLLKRALCPGRSTLSIEEQKIFQSLDCLDEKLQNVQKAITRNPFASHVLQISNP
ncbi:centrosomal protein of 126 kDa isoform X5 [Agelaius phoeniceus]|uniref:centrosomal protein of 126 kDa isoform X5 n=1 Tax=Agelaius phoeniceus TaxID=39638 RepID=UPI004054C4F9